MAYGIQCTVYLLHGVADRADARSISACNVLLTVGMLYFADSHEMATLNATKLLLLINQPKLTLTRQNRQCYPHTG